ncbi:MAG: DUF2520 domain-containing protein [Muribaculaceae bacterium]|nr:DUF2520 domain-containing protein [Muribaculaceae bacterium]
MKIAIIGRGNVAFHLEKAISMADSNHEIVLVNPHSPENSPNDCDVYILAVSDGAIKEVADSLPESSGILVHTSGSQPIEILKSSAFKNYGVFYPLQTFSKDVALDYSKIVFFIEGKNEQTIKILYKLAQSISNNVNVADSDLRKRLHIASVISCNFVNHMWAISDILLKENSLSIDVLTPLIEETLRKIKSVSPKDAQTGPAKRGDTEIIETHVNTLQVSHPDISNLYRIISNSILSFYDIKNK